MVYRFIPRTVDCTEMEVLWLVDGEAVAGRDYDVARLSWLWQVTSIEDKQIIERNQLGVNSRYYEPGPYSMQESYAGASSNGTWRSWASRPARCPDLRYPRGYRRCNR